MALPRLNARDDALGFRWSTPDGRPAALVDLLDLPGAEPDRWLPTHLEALDDVLIDVATGHSDLLAGGRPPTSDERESATAAYGAIDRAVLEYDDAWRAADLPVDLRAGQIIGTAALLSIRCRDVLGLTGPAPFYGQLDTPPPGLVGGRAGMHRVDPDKPWLGGRWLVVTDDGRRLPATLSMLLNDSSGVDSTATLREHRDALAELTRLVLDPAEGESAPEPMAASGALDWLLYDWVLAHRDGEQSAAVEIKSGGTDDALMIQSAAAASVRLRSRFDPAVH